MARKQQEWLPWYRARGYDGNLTEAEKRQLDAFRMQARHPAARSDDLPEEVQDYLSDIEMQLYDLKQDSAVNKPLAITAIAAVYIYYNYAGPFEDNILRMAFPVIAMIWSLVAYRREWKKNAEEFIPSDPGAPRPLRDEAFRRAWELDHIDRTRLRGTSEED